MPARLRALLTVVCAAVLGALLPASAAHAEGRTVQGGRLDWGVKSSFRSYVTGPIAHGSYALTGSAATTGDAFRFHSATGSYDGATGSFRAAFSGGVRFTGHETDGTYLLDLTLANPTVSVTGSTGTLYVDVVSKAKDSGAVTTSRQIPFATLALGSIDMKGDGDAVVLNNLPATLTTQGARSFAGYYTAGTALDPVSLSADVEPGQQPSSTPTETAGATKSPEPNESEKSDALADGAVDWGVRRTFREYVTGDTARGRWTLSDGAEDGGALFRFPDGEGTYDDGTLHARFAGAVRFTGAHGLDLRLSDVRVTVEDGEGTLYADVAGDGSEGSDGSDGVKVPLVTFTAKKPETAEGLVTLTEAPAKLTARGAKVFGGLYRAGTAMDPVSLAVALTDDAELPALPDLGSEPAASASPDAKSAAPETSAEPVASATGDGGFPALPVGLAAGVLLPVCAALAAVTVRRRRARTAGGTPTQS
ncbi:HtaA domain-containing protein [Streptomyces sp. CRN 30]|uniref:HtaA domain-containing protein n=1 Tax=Streptomyces sp. CRN 30 TaxID=3075613 RepID=UPI002A7FE49E|nr:HtaA domain-containing protein [Streptomyces sp. CRN 30]